MLTERDVIEIKKLLNQFVKNSQGFITLDQLNEILQNAGYEVTSNKSQSVNENSTSDEYPSGAAIASLAETWTFTLDDNTQVTKKVLCLTLQP